MQFEESTAGNSVARVFGYLLSYSIFTTILFFVLTLIRHDNPLWWQVVLITLGIVVVARLVSRWLS